MKYDKLEIASEIKNYLEKNRNAPYASVAKHLNLMGLTSKTGLEFNETLVSNFLVKQMGVRKKTKRIPKKPKQNELFGNGKSKNVSVSIPGANDKMILQSIAEIQKQNDEIKELAKTINCGLDLTAAGMKRVGEVSENIETRTTRKYKNSNRIYFLLASLVAFNTAINLFPLQPVFIANCLMVALVVNIALSIKDILK